MTVRQSLVTLRTLVIMVWALLLICLVPIFFFNYHGSWLGKIAEMFPLQY